MKPQTESLDDDFLDEFYRIQKLMNNVFLRIHGILIHLVIQQQGLHQTVFYDKNLDHSILPKGYMTVFFYLLCHLCTVNAKANLYTKMTGRNQMM